jgi:hypothetical protein
MPIAPRLRGCVRRKAKGGEKRWDGVGRWVWDSEAWRPSEYFKGLDRWTIAQPGNYRATRKLLGRF